MHLGSPIQIKKARIEIIPLIDVMFFLLASFMMVSLSMQRLRTLKMDLPSAVAQRSTEKPQMIEVKVDRSGGVTVDNRRYTLPELHEMVKERVKGDTNLPVYIKADNATTHGNVINLVDVLKATGARKVSFAIDVAPPKK